MTGDKKSNWESNKIQETWKNSKKLWVMIRELLGKKRELSDDAFIYDDDNIKHEIMTCKDSFSQRWTELIYQKLKKADFSFWYGKEGSPNCGPVNTGPKENGKLNSSQNNDIINH